MADDLYRDFRQAVDGPDETIDLARAALAMAKGEYPQLDIAAYLSRIDQLAEAVARRTGPEPDVYRSVAALNTVLFQEIGFRGNRNDYNNAMNSFLNEVIDRKTGIPITLSVLYMEVARRIELPLQGVGFPGHFLVKYAGVKEEIVIDPFNGGEVRSRESLDKFLCGLSGGRLAFRDSFLEAATKRQILTRMLYNLKGVYAKENNLKKTLSVLEHLVILDPASPDDIRDRGIVYLQLECFKQALADLENYMRLKPQAEDALEVKEQIARLSAQVAQFH